MKHAIITLVLAMTSVANASLQISVNGDTDTIDSEYVIGPSQDLILGIWTDAAIPTENGSYWALVVDTSIAYIDYTSGWVLSTDFGFFLEHSGSARDIGFTLPPGEDGIGGWAYDFETPGTPADTILFDGIIFHAVSPGNAVIKLYETPDGVEMILVDTVTIHVSESTTRPIANAGPNQVVYAWINGIAEVTLNGSGSYDNDGDELTYLWRWTIDENDYEANGVSPDIELSIGRHQIELIVNDGNEDSELDEVVIDVIGPMESQLSVVPRAINQHSEQQNIIAIFNLPVGVTQDQIDSNLVLYPGEIEARWQHISQFGRRGVVIFACFDGSALIDAVGNTGPVQLDVVGRLKTGQYFYGTDTMRIIEPPRRPSGSRRD